MILAFLILSKMFGKLKFKNINFGSISEKKTKVCKPEKLKKRKAPNIQGSQKNETGFFTHGTGHKEARYIRPISLTYVHTYIFNTKTFLAI